MYEAIKDTDLEQILLHCNELPLHHVFTHIDGTTKSPNSFGGVIGKQISGSVSNWEVKRLNPTPFTDFPILSQSIVKDFSDQFYAYRICQAVISGEMDEDLGMLEIGLLCHSRWLTLGCRLLRFYVMQEKPSKSLVT